MSDTDIPSPSGHLPEIVWRMALDGVAVAVFMLRADGEILYCNRYGDAFLRGGKVFRRFKKRISVRRHNDDDAFLAALHRVHSQQQAELLRLRLRTGEVGCLVNIEPVPGGEILLASIAELRLPLDRDVGWSRDLLGLRAFDADLAEALAIGQSLQEIAEQTATPVGTLRTRLKKLFARTGTDTQARLAALLLRGASIYVQRK